MKRPQQSTEGETSVSKRRRLASTSEDDDCSRGQAVAVNFGDAPPLHKIYNSSCRKEKPDELFRKDLISAMKLPDNEQLDEAEFWDVSDSWKQEWERGVQVPVNSKNVPNPDVRILRERSKSVLFKLPKKLMRTTEDNFFSSEHHVLTDTGAKAEKVCKYDMDDLDTQWLILFNEYREDGGKQHIREETMERVLEDFELQCSNGFQDALKTEKGLGIEYDENVVCEVCRARENEDGNEMVFCDICNICVHQACYGIMAIPEGSWVCRPCAANVKPPCVLCPNTGGAMKCTSGEKWAHVSCALWIPEVSIGDPEKMEPIMRISQIPASRWALICTLCRERVGACIQCSVKQCKVAYHVTCAIENGLEMEMKTTPIDSSEQGVKMQSFCFKHGKNDASPEKSSIKISKKKRRKKEGDGDKAPENEVDEHNARLQKIRSLEAEFYNYVSIKETVEVTKVEYDIVTYLYYYWLLKRKAQFNKPLLITKCDEANLLIKQHENLLYSRLKMFVHLRQDLERVRNLCYMISRREKLFRSYLRTRNDVFEKQLEVLNEESPNLTEKEIKEIVKCRGGDNLYDKFYCVSLEEEKEKTPEKELAPKLPNPYSKPYPNNIHTRSRRLTTTQSVSDNFDNDSRDMPVLVKCKSEENVSTIETRKQPILTHSPFVIKIEPTAESENNQKTTETNSDIPVLPKAVLEKSIDISETQSPVKLESNNIEMLKGSYENTSVKSKKPVHVNEIASDKISLCLSDKENINAQKPVKVKRTRSQNDARHAEIKNNIFEVNGSKNEILIEEHIDNEIITISQSKKNSKLDKRSTRYPTRNRFHSTEINLENDAASEKSIDSVDTYASTSDGTEFKSSPSNSIEEFTFVSQNTERNEINGEVSPQIQRKRPGRPRKLPRLEAIPNDISINKDAANLDNEKTSLCDSMLELSDSNQSSFTMSLRNGKEHIISPSRRKKGRKRRGRASVKLDHSDPLPLKETNQSTVSEGIDQRDDKSSPDWDSEDTRLPRLASFEPPAPTRIVIRIRKEPNDSSSSSDVPAAFHIVRNDINANSENSVSEFPSKINGDMSPESPTSRDDNDCRHRYSMRERSVTPRSLKCTFSRS
ncbi:PHD finger protein rhinoceros isoform X2 [Parasteatoda tepidariorum]|uniref:PHD finger protein rhinoceros isoform X2 n=1 Tax=Parasteatoda tepidariorum TaxID=114398 RepID=UPI001C727303|nr:PHD finger protein rhinoceros isoform X2 [Parasteatoda tepidariorum]